MSKSSYSIRRSLTAAAAWSLLAMPLGAAAATSSATATPASLPVQSAGPGDIVIGPNDTVDVEVFQVKDLSGTLQVDSSGKILMPLIGEVPAAGKTPDQLSHDIAAELGDKYMKHPQVSVTVKDSTSQKITIDGAVNKPGIYPLNGPTTLLQAISLGGGPDPKLSNTHKVSVIRTANNGSRSASTYDLEAIRQGKLADPQVYPKDEVVVATSGGKSFLQNWGGVLPLLALLRP